MDAAAAKARLSAKKQQSQSLKVQPTHEPLAVIPEAHRLSSPEPLVSPVPVTFPKKLRFSDVEVAASQEETADDVKTLETARSATSTQAETEQIQVFLRIRPMTETERKTTPVPVLTVEPPATVRVNAPESSQAFKFGEKTGTFTFSHVFDENVGQDELYNQSVANAARSAIFEGTNAHIFAYGMTNAGKTFTITGPDDNPGVLPRTLASIFRHIESIDTCSDIGKLPSGAVSSDFVVSVSYVEIYNEQCFDLLMGGSTSGKSVNGSMTFTRAPLQIKDGRDGVAYVKSLHHVTVTTAQSALEIMKQGTHNKRVADTSMNSDSSRSHTVFTISIYINQTGATGGEGVSSKAPKEVFNSTTGTVAPGYKLWSRINVVDLAGSERQSRTNANGARLKEAGAINNSLMQLMKCFEAMRYNTMNPDKPKKMVPFRDTKLTRLFADSFGGLSTGVTVMIVNTGQAAADFDETLHALKYGALAKDVRVVKDRLVTRWEPSQYNEHGRKITAKGAAAATAGGVVSAAEVDGDVKAKHGVGMMMVAKKATEAPLATLVAAAAASRADKTSIGSVDSATSAISMSLVNAVLHEGATTEEEEAAAAPSGMYVDEEVEGEDGDDLLCCPRGAKLLEMIHMLSSENEQLHSRLEESAEQLLAMEEQVLQVEAETSAKNAAEMEQMLRERDELHKTKLAMELKKVEDKYMKQNKLYSLSTKGVRASVNTRQSSISACTNDELEEKIEELEAHVGVCEAEIERLRKQHAEELKDYARRAAADKAEIIRLRDELTHANVTAKEPLARKSAQAIASHDADEERVSKLTHLCDVLRSQLAEAEDKEQELDQELKASRNIAKDLRESLHNALEMAEKKQAEITKLKTRLSELEKAAAKPSEQQSAPPSWPSAATVGFTTMSTRIQLKPAATETTENEPLKKRSRAKISSVDEAPAANPRKRSRGNSVEPGGVAPSTKTKDAENDLHDEILVFSPATKEVPKVSNIKDIRSPLAHSHAENADASRAKTSRIPRAAQQTAASRAKMAVVPPAPPTRTPMLQRLRARK